MGSGQYPKIVEMETRELYEKLVSNQNIDGEIEYNGFQIIWKRSGNVHLQFDCEMVEVYANNKLLTHWHEPDYEHLCSFGEKEKLLVITRHLIGSISYCPVSAKDYDKRRTTKCLFGRKYIFGRI